MPVLAEIGLVLDVNVWIDACVGAQAGAGCPMPWWGPTDSDRRRAAAALFAALSEPLRAPVQVAVDDLLFDTVLRKLTQPTTANASAARGLGWDLDLAQERLDELLEPLHAAGRVVHFQPAAVAHPLQGADYEDERIWGLFMAAYSTWTESDMFLVTSDKAFANQALSARYRLAGTQNWSWMPGSPGRLVRLLANVRIPPAPAP